VARHHYSVVCFDQPGDDPVAFFNVNSAQELGQLISH
jgi:molybdopterin-guanine dinucleotide biosynthesis protein A